MYTVKKVNGKRCNLTTMEQHFNYILKFCNYNFFNVDKSFVIQLFDKKYFANDEHDCIAEFYSTSIVDVIFQTIEWIEEYMKGE